MNQRKNSPFCPFRPFGSVRIRNYAQTSEPQRTDDCGWTDRERFAINERNSSHLQSEPVVCLLINGLFSVLASINGPEQN